MPNVRPCVLFLFLVCAIAFFSFGESPCSADGFNGAKSKWHDFDRYDFKVDGRKCIVVVPETAAEGRPWIWRARFFGHEPQADIALLKRGFHLAYCDVAGLYGSPKAVAHWDAFYREMVDKHRLSIRPALEGMSRGGLIVYNWATANPKNVACIYGDAPVCDFKSWPGGKGTGKGSDASWRECLAAYSLTEDAALAYQYNPIDKLKALAEHNVPLLHVVGDADAVVPVSENTAIVESRYQELGGSIQVIHKPGVGHHPHALVDPQPIVRFVLQHTTTSVKADPPNVILIFIDDMGWGDLGCYGNDFIETPHIDQLAADGLRFTDFYAAAAVCSPTRCALQSGQNQARIGITAHIPGHWRPFERVITPLTTMALPLDTVTVAESLKAEGYATGYVGKWHLGNGPRYQPDRQGYDFSAVINGPHLPGKYRVQGTPQRQPSPGQYRTDFEADLSIDFIRGNKDKPFFLMLSPFAVHIPLGAMSEKVEKYRQKGAESNRQLPHPVYAAMVEHCDDMVGRILATVDREGLSEKTMIVFTSDNGGLYRRYDYREKADDNVSSLAPLHGEKGTLYEGGVRVPLIVKYPPMTQAGTVCSEPTISYDFYPTFVDLADGSLPENQTIDGHSLRPLFEDPDGRLDRESLYWHYPHYHHDRPASSIRSRDWKLIEYLDGTNDLELYHLSEDLGETRNLADEKKEKAKDLVSRLRTWRHSVSARMPIPNPGYDPKRADEWWSLGRGKPIDSDRRTRFPPTELD